MSERPLVTAKLPLGKVVVHSEMVPLFLNRGYCLNIPEPIVNLAAAATIGKVYSAFCPKAQVEFVLFAPSISSTLTHIDYMLVIFYCEAFFPNGMSSESELYVSGLRSFHIRERKFLTEGPANRIVLQKRLLRNYTPTHRGDQ